MTRRLYLLLQNVMKIERDEKREWKGRRERKIVMVMLNLQYRLLQHKS